MKKIHVTQKAGKVIFLIALLAIVSTGMVFAGGAKEEAAEKESGQVLRIIHDSYENTWSPLKGGSPFSRWLSLWWAPPFYYDMDGNMQSVVFSDSSSNSDFTVWNFTINDKAVFSDGSPITAEDVKGTWELCAVPSTKHQRADLFLSGIVGFDGVMNGNSTVMSGITVKGQKSLEVKLSAPDPIFAQKLATNLIGPVKISQARDSNGEEVSEWWHPKNGVVCSGPFMPTSMDLNTGIVEFIPNPNYFGQKPKLDKIIFTTVEDMQSATLMLKRGQMDAHTYLNTPTVVEDLGIEFVEGPMLANGHHFWIQSSKKPMEDINLRKALIMSVDTEELHRAAYPDFPNKPATQILNNVKGVDPNYEPYPYDPEAAKAALAASTYKNARNLPKIMFVGISVPAYEAAAQYIAEQWRQVLGIEGVEMKPAIDSYDGPDQAGVQIFRDDVGTRVPDAVSYLMGAIHSSSGNAQRKMGGYKNAEVDKLLEDAAKKGMNDPQRIALAQKAQKIFRDEWMFIPFIYSNMPKFSMPWVKNMAKNDDWQVIEPWNLEIDEAMKASMTE